MNFLNFIQALAVFVAIGWFMYTLWSLCNIDEILGDDEDEHATMHNGPGLPHHRRKK